MLTAGNGQVIKNQLIEKNKSPVTGHLVKILTVL